ncbi:MAG: thioesterase family protein [Emcibacter sp.]|nr:thioesterase family protein [Emcibacter sp.]
MPEEDKYGPILLESSVKAEWIDFNGHMNMAYYIILFDQAMTNFLEDIDLGSNYTKKHGKSIFALENHVTYQHELKQNDPVCVHFQLLDMDSKFIHCFMRIFHGGSAVLSATMEQIALHVNMDTRMPARFAQDKMDILRQTVEKHKTYGIPRETGRSIAIRRPQKSP